MSKSRITPLLAICLLSLTSNAHSAPFQSEPGALEGMVTRAGTTEGIPGVKVTLSGGPVDPISLRALATAGQTIGYFIPAQATTPAAPQSGNPTAASVPPAPPVSDESILQSVLDSATSNGMSPGNASLTIALNNFRDQTAKYRTMTDGSGRFILSNIPPGQYSVRSERDGFFGTHGTTATVTVVSNKTATTALSMVQGATAGGTIRDEDGEPLANATVEIFQVIYPNGFPSLGAAVTAKTNFRGEYRLFWMPAGEYYVGASREVYATQGARVFYPGTPELTAATPISLKSGQDRDRVDFVLTSARMMRISGVVTSTAPAPAPPTLPAGVQLTPAIQAALLSATRNVAMLGLVSRNPNVPDASDNPEVATVTLKDNRAEFEFTAPSGSYEFAGVVPSGGFGKVSLDIADSDISGVALTIQPPIVVKGILVSNGTAPDFTKMRVSMQAKERLDAEVGGLIGNGPIRPSVSADGSFTFPAIANSHMVPVLQALPSGTYVADVRQDGNSAYDSGIEITSNLPPIQIVLSSDGGAVKGSVLDPAGKPLAKAIIVLAPPPARRQNRALFMQTASDANGRFTISNVPPGEYKLFAWPGGIPGGSFYNATFLARYEDRGRTVSLGLSATITVDGITVPLD